MDVPVRFAPYSADWLANPYDQYRELRSDDPVHWSEEVGHWVLTRYSDVVSVLRDPRFTASNRPPQRRWGQPTTMVTADPPDHARLRRPVSHRFTTWSVEQWRPRIQQVVDALLDAAETNGEMDILWELARPLPRTIICEMLGVALPTNGQQPSRGTAAERMPATYASGDPSTRRAPTLAQGIEMLPEASFVDAIAQHREASGDDLLHDLLAAQRAGQLSDEEVLDTAVILFGAGLETTANMIGNGVYQLLRHPDHLAKLGTDPSLVPAAAEELLRFDPPVHAISRRALEDVDVGGRTVRRGEKVLCVLAAANRDPEVFERPDDLDLARRDNQHVAFGAGMHACLGATLARAEIEVALGSLTARFPRLRLSTDDVEWEGSFIIRGVRRLLVALG